MKMDWVIGFQDQQGISKKGQGEPYQMGRLYVLRPLRSWKNEHGRCNSHGFVGDEYGVMEVDLMRPGLVKKIEELSSHFPCALELTLEPNPQNPMRNIVVDVDLV